MRQNDCREGAPLEASLEWRSERGLACGFVMLAHLLAVWVVTRPSPAGTETTPPMELVYVQLAPPALDKAKVHERRAIPAAMTAKRPHSPQPTKAIQIPTAEAPTASPQTIADDRWDLTAGHTQKDDGIRFTRNKLTESFNPVQPSSPERFRMRGQLSAADIVRAVSKELFWPPGYADDPCGGLAKAVEILSRAPTARERGMLEDAVKQQSRYCR